MDHRTNNENRHIAFEGIHNFRDMGGYQTHDGKQVKRGLLYRSGHLAKNTEKDIKRLSELNIKTIVDFRSLEETQLHPNPELEGTRYLHLPAAADGQINADMKSIPRMGSDMMVRFYAEIPIGNAAFRQLFQMLLSGDHTPLLIHCTAGKDRTGGASALILMALGVPMETIMEDYLLTNVHLKDFTEQVIAMYRPMLSEEEVKNMEMMLSARADFLNASIKKINEVYGDFDTYLSKDLGLSDHDRQRLMDLYLE